MAVYKIRHVYMGVWQQKLYQAMLLARIGPERFAALHGRPPAGSPPILPPGGAVTRLLDTALEDLRRAAAALGPLATGEGGSNSWAVHGSRTTTGAPVLCNDSHRALDVPSVYWQVHVSCPAFDVIGATFPGLPGFPHFGHNGHVAWSITHTGADYQDLYVERFEDQGARYAAPQGWLPSERRVERIEVAGSRPVEVECWRTRHGPVVHGDPRQGWALALRYTATDGPCRAWETLRPMLLARTVGELHESQREWVDPVNNLVSADTAGNIAYLMRGAVPVRTSDGPPPVPRPRLDGGARVGGPAPVRGAAPGGQSPRGVHRHRQPGRPGGGPAADAVHRPRVLRPLPGGADRGGADGPGAPLPPGDRRPAGGHHLPRRPGLGAPPGPLRPRRRAVRRASSCVRGGGG